MNFHRVTAALLIALACAGAHGVGFQRLSTTVPGDVVLEGGIWYPSDTAAVPLAVGPVSQVVAPGGVLAGRQLPLIVISHGTGGSFLSHHDTAYALAQAGYVVASVTHPGDNHADASRALHVMDRPRHLARLIDYMLSTWPGHAQLDASRIGVFGFSAGGFTALVSIGGSPKLAKIGPFCREHAAHFACRLIGDAAPPPSEREGAADARIKAAVVAAPALGFSFAPEGLKHVAVPVQLWHAEDDAITPSPWYAQAIRDALPEAPDYRLVPKAGHFDFIAPCSAGLAARLPEVCSSAVGFDRQAFHRLFNTAVTEFFDRTLKR